MAQIKFLTVPGSIYNNCHYHDCDCWRNSGHGWYGNVTVICFLNKTQEPNDLIRYIEHLEHNAPTPTSAYEPYIHNYDISYTWNGDYGFQILLPVTCVVNCHDELIFEGILLSDILDKYINQN